jgi:uncharacterized protein (TIGR03437 family)
MKPHSELLPVLFLMSCVVQAQPSIASGGIVSAAAFGGFSSIAPCSWIEIYGTNLADDTRGWGTSDFNGVIAPTSLDGTSVTIGGQAAFIDYVSPTQVNAQVPSNVVAGSQQVIVNTAKGPSATYAIQVNAVQPGLLAPASFNVGSTQYVAALFSDGSTYVLPPGAIPGVTSRPAQPGETITLYGVGFGPVIPGIPAGQIEQQSNSLAAQFQVSIGNVQAVVKYDGLAPNSVGLYQFNVVVPDVPSSDAVPLTFDVGGVPGSQTLFIAIHGTSSGGTLPLFAGILGNVTFTGNGETSLIAHLQVIREEGDASYTYATVYAQYLPFSTPASVISAFFNQVTISGDTFTLGDLSPGPSGITVQTSTYGITAASVTFTLTPNGAPGVGNVTGSYSFTSSQGTLTGTITGTYTAQ